LGFSRANRSPERSPEYFDLDTPFDPDSSISEELENDEHIIYKTIDDIRIITPSILIRLHPGSISKKIYNTYRHSARLDEVQKSAILRLSILKRWLKSHPPNEHAEHIHEVTSKWLRKAHYPELLPFANGGTRKRKNRKTRKHRKSYKR
jgi:hypothetical protein